MAEMTATAAEARANFSRIANQVSRSRRPITVLKNSKPWVTISPIDEDSPVVGLDLSALAPLPIDPQFGHAILPAEWDDPADEGLYDDLA